MRFFSADSTLYEMEQQLENYFFEEEHNLRIIGDLPISFEDYKYLNFKMKGIIQYISRVEVLEQYRLCFLTTLIFAIQFEKNVKMTLKHYEQFMNQFQQHQFRFCMRMLAETFHEMGLSTYNISVNSSKDLLELLVIHTSLPKNKSEEIFEILEDYFTQKQCYLLDEEIYSQLDRTLLGIYPFLSLDGKGFQLSHLLKELYEACYLEHKSLEQLFDDFDTLPKQLIEDCYRWFNTYSENSTNLIKIR